jgi:N-hydroxyarylamine O-acetyltransferase
MFDTPFDLDSYLARIAYAGDRSPTLSTLRTIASRHPAAIPFENLDALLRRPVALDPVSLQQKLVASRRGGWCFEHNLLLGHALTALGFSVTGLAARVLWLAPPGPPRPRSHMLLRVDLPASSTPSRRDGAASDAHLVDVGFGGLTLTGALQFVPDLEQETPHETFRIRSGGLPRRGAVPSDRGGTESSAEFAPRNPHASDPFVMEAQVAGEWRALYTFDAQPQELADYEVSNWYLLNHPSSHFLTTLVAARIEPDRRYALRNSDLSVHHRSGITERTTLVSSSEIRRALDELFHIDVPQGPDVDAELERLLPVAL